MHTIIIHCSDSPQDRGDNAETIHFWHKEGGFDGIGYHDVILESGEIDKGRPLYWTGAHAKGHNTDTIGICLIGEDEFTPQQMAALHYLLYQYRVKYPKAKIVGHNELDPTKECPGFDVQEWLKRIGFDA
jgi:hypothetical protein